MTDHPVDSTTHRCCQGIGRHAPDCAMVSALTDVGPAASPPNWCPPDTEPRWEYLAKRLGGAAVCCWSRSLSEDVWIEAEDRVVDGRVMRSAPRIVYFDPPTDGVSAAQARELARALVAAADVITCAAFDETQR